ncbi:MAG: exosortase-associated EpsI family protein [Verrucomicrobia bacterium]|nr:exosortase-associated EpsI family protein [Verrucomicrobiota bacterium]
MNRQKWILLAVTVGLIAGAGGVLLRLKATQKLGAPGLRVSQLPDRDALQIDLPGRVADCTSEFLEPAKEELGALPKDTTIGRRLYKFPDSFEMLLTVVMMGADRTSIHKPQFCLTGQGWTIEKTELTTVPVAKPHAYDLPVMKLTTAKTVKTTEGRSVALRGVYVYWFVADNQLTAQHWQRMWWMARDLLRRGVLQRWAYVTCFATCLPGQEEATFARMKQFIGSAVPDFQLASGPHLAALPGVTETR